MQMAATPVRPQTTPRHHVTAAPGRAPVQGAGATYFAVAGRSRRLEPAEPCPAYPPLTLEGVAVDRSGGLYLVLAVLGISAWIGPTLRDVRRKVHLIAEALGDTGSLPTVDWQGVLEWLTDAWSTAASPAIPHRDSMVADETAWLSDLRSRQQALSTDGS